MYIALKWLVGLSLTMWIVLCCIDIYVKYRNEVFKNANPFEALEWNFKNISNQLELKPDPQISKILQSKKNIQFDVVGLHYVMFFAGAVAVSLFNKKTQIILFTKNAFSKCDICAVLILVKSNLNYTAIVLCVATKKYLKIIWDNIIKLVGSVQDMRSDIKTNVVEKHKRLNVLLLQKLKEFGEERKNLGQLLIAAVNENKNIRIQHQLESMAKNRLVRHVEDTQMKIKDNRSKYVSFRQLYLVTYQENMFLKARIRKLTQEKDNAEKDLMTIMSKVFNSKNKDLKEYCSQFIVKPDHNLLNSNVKAEVQKCMLKSQVSRPTTSWHNPAASRIEGSDVKFWSQSGNRNCLAEISSDEFIVPLNSDVPRFKGLPGECIWTVKDKDGMIEKLYEYDYESDFDNGDTIRRIREYSVYYDKDCLLDFSSSRSIIGDPISLHNLHSTNERFLTGSEAFQNFMRNNKDIVKSTRSRSYAPSLL